MKLNITPGPWHPEMPKQGKRNAKINASDLGCIAKVNVRSKLVDGGLWDEASGYNNLTAIVTAVNNTYHKGINPEAVPEMLEFLAAIARHPKNDTLADFLIDDAKKLIQKSIL